MRLPIWIHGVGSLGSGMAGNCEMIRTVVADGGGNTLAETSIIVRRTAAIGDVVCSTVIADRLIEMGFNVSFQAHPATHCLLRRHKRLTSISEPGGFCHINLDGAYENDPARRLKHFHQMFFDVAQSQLRGRGLELGAPANLKPSIVVEPHEVEAAKAKFQDHPRPWVFICPRSNTYIPRQVSDGVWQAIASKIQGTSFWIGTHPAPTGLIDLRCSHLDNLAWYLSAADLLVTVDTGPAHIGAALGIPMVVLGQSSSPELHYSDQRDFETIWPMGNLDCLNCQKNLCPKSYYYPPCHSFDVDKVSRLIAGKLNPKRVAALIPTFDADPNMLFKTIANVTPQVDEVVITVAADGKIHPSVPMNPKVKIVRCPRSGIGFGRNVNFGMRHTSAPWVLLLNDDCYLNGDCVEKLLDLRAPEVGMIAHLLRYPTGQIYFAGRRRRPGDRGFPHINHRDYHPDISSVSEMEAVSGTSVLINRKAFYKIGGFDERFFMYAEDDDISMRMRQAGYKLLYHPTALGVHEGSATTKRVGNMYQWIKTSGELMEKLWGWYWTKNANRIPGTFS